MRVDLNTVIRMVKRNAIIIIAITIIAYMSSFYYYRYTAVPTYTASVKMVIQITDELVGTSTSASGSITLAERVGETCKIIFQDQLFLNELSDTLDNKYSPGQLGGMLSIYTVEDSEILGVSVTSTDPQAAAAVANAFLKTAPFFFKNVYNNTRIVALSEASVPTTQNYVDFSSSGLKYALLAFVLSAGIALLIEALNAKVKSEDNLFEIYGAPVFANIPDMLQAENRSKKYKYEYEYGYEENLEKGGSK